MAPVRIVPALERRFIISLTVIAGAVGALAEGLTSEAARWLWATFLAVVSSGWALDALKSLL